jgi:hypothetical protein
MIEYLQAEILEAKAELQRLREHISLGVTNVLSLVALVPK